MTDSKLYVGCQIRMRGEISSLPAKSLRISDSLFANGFSASDTTFPTGPRLLSANPGKVQVSGFRCRVPGVACQVTEGKAAHSLEGESALPALRAPHFLVETRPTGWASMLTFVSAPSAFALVREVILVASRDHAEQSITRVFRTFVQAARPPSPRLKTPGTCLRSRRPSA